MGVNRLVHSRGSGGWAPGGRETESLTIVPVLRGFARPRGGARGRCPRDTRGDRACTLPVPDAGPKRLCRGGLESRSERLVERE